MLSTLCALLQLTREVGFVIFFLFPDEYSELQLVS